MSLTLYLGGARSGKSALAVRRAAATGGPVVFIATARAGDEEMAERIERHRAERPTGWTVVEAPIAVREALSSVDPQACVVVDCTTLWVSNLLDAGWSEEEVQGEARALATAGADRPGETIVVGNEVGLGLVPMEQESRHYRDVLGRVHAALADLAEEAGLVVAGRILPLQRVP